MKRFLFKITLLFLLPVLLMVCGYEVALRHIPNDYSFKNEMMRSHSHQIETLILGSSHSLRGVNPQAFTTDAFNLAMVSQTLEFDYLLFVKYHADLTQLKRIILPISYFSLFSDMENGPEPWRMKNYAIYYHLHPVGGISGLKNRFELFHTDYQIGLARITDYYLNGIAAISCDDNGWAGRESREVEADHFKKSGAKAANRHTENLDDPAVELRLEKNLEYLNALLSWARAHHIQVILFTPPARTEYRQHLDLRQLNRTIEIAEELAGEYSNCRYINFLNDPRFSNDDFFDADHLNTTGAWKLSKILDED